MKILAGLIASCLVAMPVFAQGDPPADTGQAGRGRAAAGRRAGRGGRRRRQACRHARPSRRKPPKGTTPDKPAETPEG